MIEGDQFVTVFEAYKHKLFYKFDLFWKMYPQGDNSKSGLTLRPIESIRKITSSEGNVVFEIEVMFADPVGLRLMELNKSSMIVARKRSSSVIWIEAE